MSKKIQKIIASLVFLAGGIIFIVLGFTGMSQAKNFPEIQAKVSKIEVEEFLDENGDNRSDITVYVSYNVDGKEYNEILQDAQASLQRELQSLHVIIPKSRITLRLPQLKAELSD